jgi:prepilin-type N-terminal cleavage/methylation domain-containing protein
MRTVRAQHGFTLVELLISMVLVVIVFGATLTVLDAFSHQTQGNLQRNDAQNAARLSIDRIVRQLRNIASPLTTPKLLERAAPYDIVFQTVGTPSGSNTSGAERVMYCIPQDTASGDPNHEVLYSETQTWTTATAPANPWSSDPTQTIACPDNPLPSGVSSAVKIATAITNRYQGNSSPSRNAFTYNNGSAPSDLSKVFTVQIDLLVNPTPTNTHAESELHSAAFLRNQPRAPVANFTSTPTGGGGVLLNGGTSYSPDGEDLSFSWSCTSPSPCPSAGGLTGSNSGLVTWEPGAGTYTVSLTVTDQTGLIATTSQNVTVT